jgi:hypothetical protein
MFSRFSFGRLSLLTLCFLHLLYPMGLWAGAVSLTSEEIPRLRALVATNSAASAQFEDMAKKADAALKDEPHPIDKVISEGHLARDPRKVLTQAALADVAKVEALAWAWAVTGDARYVVQGRKFLLAWAAINKADANPINETKFEPMIVAYDLLRPGFTGARSGCGGWLAAK